MEHSRCTLDIPYPEIETSGRNITYANLLLNNYAGPVGELTAITQYFYQYFIVKYRHGEFARSLECISIVEMRHMEMLGELVVQLGGNPLLRTCSGNRSVFWRGNNISPNQNICGFLMGNIEAERQAIDQYRLRISQICDTKVQRVLERIILDEEHHIRIFEEYRGVFKC